jgi:hypothetical protein
MNCYPGVLLIRRLSRYLAATNTAKGLMFGMIDALECVPFVVVGQYIYILFCFPVLWLLEYFRNLTQIPCQILQKRSLRQEALP